jgi:hypothetical protein
MAGDTVRRAAFAEIRAGTAGGYGLLVERLGSEPLPAGLLSSHQTICPTPVFRSRRRANCIEDKL